MRVLLDLEQRLQSWEVTLKDCQLPALTQEDVAMVQQLDAALNLPATIREELDFDFEEMVSLARFHFIIAKFELSSSPYCFLFILNSGTELS